MAIRNYCLPIHQRETMERKKLRSDDTLASVKYSFLECFSLLIGHFFLSGSAALHPYLGDQGQGMIVNTCWIERLDAIDEAVSLPRHCLYTSGCAYLLILDTFGNFHPSPSPFVFVCVTVSWSVCLCLCLCLSVSLSCLSVSLSLPVSLSLLPPSLWLSCCYY